MCQLLIKLYSYPTVYSKDRDETTKSLVRIGSELDVSYIVTGSGRKIADIIRISIRLYEASTERLLWTNTFDGKN